MESIRRFVQEVYDGISPPVRGAIFMMLAAFSFTVMHSTIRYLSSEIHPFEIAFFRNLFGFAVLLPFLVRKGPSALHTGRLPFHILRSALQICAMLTFFYAISITELAKVSAMSFTAPLFATIGAVLFLGEKIRIRRIAALVLGFVGALIIIRPGVEAVDFGMLLVLGSSAVWACAMLVIKVLSRTDSSVTVTAYMGIFMTPLSLVPALFVWQWPTYHELAWFVVLGIAGTCGHLCFTQSFKEADTSAVVPFDFTRLIWASLLGFVFFTEIPEVWTWVGGAVIFASTFYIAVRESREARRSR